jgi:hypothetical protein
MAEDRQYPLHGMTKSSEYYGGVAAASSQQQDPIVSDVLATPDLLLSILLPLIDGDFLSTLASLSLVSTNFHQATKSNQLWREVCYQRWKTKWGFHPRWEKALMDYTECLTKQQQHQLTKEDPKRAACNFWRQRYFSEEQDATRNLIQADELKLLVFDFRFWIGRPTVVDDGHIMVKSGLMESASTEVRFVRPSKFGERFQEEEEDFSGMTRSFRGHVTGHPCKEANMECK